MGNNTSVDAQQVQLSVSINNVLLAMQFEVKFRPIQLAELDVLLTQWNFISGIRMQQQTEGLNLCCTTSPTNRDKQYLGECGTAIPSLSPMGLFII